MPHHMFNEHYHFLFDEINESFACFFFKYPSQTLLVGDRKEPLYRAHLPRKSGDELLDEAQNLIKTQ